MDSMNTDLLEGLLPLPWTYPSAYPTPPPPANAPDTNLVWFAPGSTSEYFQTGGTCPIIGQVGNHGPFIALNLQYFLDLLGSSQGACGNASPWGYSPYSTTTTASAPSSESLFGTGPVVDPILPTHNGNAVPHGTRKRGRTAKACASCHDSRKTCGEARPCVRCAQRGLPCEDRPRKRSRTSRDPPQEVANAKTVHTSEPGWSGLQV